MYWIAVGSTWSIIFNLAGLLSSLATAYIYDFVHRAKNLEERCIFHFSVSLAMTEFVILINIVTVGLFRHNIQLQDMSAHVSTTYALSSFLWSLMLMIHLRKKFTPRLNEAWTNSESIPNDSELMKKYFLIGYGIPFLAFSCNYAGLNFRDRANVAFYTVIVDIAIIIANGLISFVISKNLLHQAYSFQSSLTSNEPVKVNIKQVKYRLQLVSRLFHTLVLPWLIFWVVIIVASPRVRDKVILIGTTCLIGLQGMSWFYIMVVRRKRIWKDLENKYGWKTPAQVSKLDKMCGYISEDDDDDGVMDSTTRWDVLAMIYNMTQKKKPTKTEDQLPNPAVYSRRETQNLQPAIHQFVRCEGLSERVNHTEASEKLVRVPV